MKDKYIAFLDILGFKDLVNNNSLEGLKSLYSKVLKEAFHLAQMQLEEKLPVMRAIRINSAIISDSIIIWTDNIDHGSFVKMVFVVQGLMLKSFMNGLCLRGSITAGEIEDLNIDFPQDLGIVKSPIILGKGVVEAYQLEQSQKWCGCIISHDAIRKFSRTLEDNNTLFGISQLMLLQLICIYDAPLSNSKVERCYCVSLITMDERVLLLEHGIETRLLAQVADKFSMHNKSISSDEVQVKIKNTTQFIYFLYQQFTLRPR